MDDPIKENRPVITIVLADWLGFGEKKVNKCIQYIYCNVHLNKKMWIFEMKELISILTVDLGGMAVGQGLDMVTGQEMGGYAR